LAERLTHRLSHLCQSTGQAAGGQRQFSISKQLAQHLLIEASFQHQFCLHHFRVMTDLYQQQLPAGMLEELLLYLRMTPRHPSHHQVLTVMSRIQPDNSRCEEHLEKLQEQRLIQKITHRGQVFYDKNPLPHAHLYDPEKNCLFDHHCQLDSANLELISG
jgi:DNA-binding transcriptional MerR regulator